MRAHTRTGALYAREFPSLLHSHGSKVRRMAILPKNGGKFCYTGKPCFATKYAIYGVVRAKIDFSIDEANGVVATKTAKFGGLPNEKINKNLEFVAK